MHTLVASPAAALPLPPRGTALTRDELERTVGGVDPVSIAVLVFGAGVVIGVLDRIFFGGCRCRK